MTDSMMQLLGTWAAVQALIVIPVCRIYARAGYKWYWGLLCLVPVAGIVMLPGALGFGQWPKFATGEVKSQGQHSLWWVAGFSVLFLTYRLFDQPDSPIPGLILLLTWAYITMGVASIYGKTGFSRWNGILGGGLVITNLVWPWHLAFNKWPKEEELRGQKLKDPLDRMIDNAMKQRAEATLRAMATAVDRAKAAKGKPSAAPASAGSAKGNKSALARAAQSEELANFLEGIENKILERGLLTDVVGRGDFVISLSAAVDTLSDQEVIKLVLNFEDEAPPIELSYDQCDEIQDIVLDYANEKGLSDVLQGCGVPEGDADVAWVHVSVDGEFIG